MGIVLYRVDERLIHGQVIVGWGSQLRPERYLVVDEELAGSEWEQELYRLGAGETEVVFATVEDARDRIPGWKEDEARSILLTRDLATTRALARAGLLAGETVNVGGIHHAPGRTQILTYVHLSDGDRADLRALENEGVTVSARDLPDAQPVALPALLDS